MKISLDGGALCSKENIRFGNYTFTRNLIEAFQRYDQENEYLIYSFCQKPSWLIRSEKMTYKILRPKILWLSSRVSLEELWQKKNIFLALNQAIPLKTNSRIISFFHGFSFYFYPKLYPDSYYALKDQLGAMIKKSRYIIVSSRRVKREMSKLYPGYRNFVVNNYGVPFDMLKKKFKVENQKTNVNKKYFLYVGMNHPIKNIEFLVRLFKQFRRDKHYLDYKLFLVGNLDKFEDNENNIFSYSNIGREQLRKLYEEATAYLTASLYESFNFPVLEALSQNCPVIGLKDAIIPEFNDSISLAYDSNDFIKKMIDIAQGRRAKIEREKIIKRFSWQKYVSKLKELYD